VGGALRREEDIGLAARVDAIHLPLGEVGWGLEPRRVRVKVGGQRAQLDQPRRRQVIRQISTGNPAEQGATSRLRDAVQGHADVERAVARRDRFGRADLRFRRQRPQPG
jgi:hypothetical protein